MWKQAPSSAAACSFLIRRGNTDDGAVSKCDDFQTSELSRASLHLTTIWAPTDCQAIEQIKRSLIAPSTQLRLGSPCRLDRDGGNVEEGEICSSSESPPVLDGSRSSSHREKGKKTRWKLHSSEPEAEQIIISPTVNQSQAKSRCLTTPESRQIDDMQTDSSSLVDLSTTSLGRVLNTPSTPRVQKAHYMNYWSQRKKRKLRSSFGSGQESTPLLGFSPWGSSAVECLTTQESSSISRTTNQALYQYDYYMLEPGAGTQKSPGASELTSEPQFPMADQEGSRSSSVDEVVGPLQSRSRGSSPGPPDPVQEPLELRGSSEQSLPSEVLERTIAAYTRPLPPANVEPSQGLGLVGSRPAGPEREFYPPTATPLALERGREREIPHQEIHQTQLLRTFRPAPQVELDIQNPSSRRGLVRQSSGSRQPPEDTARNEEAGSSWLQLGIATAQPEASGSGNATVQESEAATQRFTYPEVSRSPVVGATSLEPTEINVERQPPLDPPGESLSQSLRRAQLPPFFPSFQSRQDPGSSARGHEFGTGDMSELDPSAFLVPQVLPPPRSDPHQASGMLFSRQSTPRTSSHQVQYHGVNIPGRFPFLERGDGRQPAAGAGHSLTAGEGPYQSHIEFFQLPSPSMPAPSESRRMMQSGEAGPSTVSFDRPRSSDQRPASTPFEQLTFGSLPWSREIPASTSTTGVLRGMSSAAALEAAAQGGQMPQDSWLRLLERVGPTNVPFRPPLTPAAAPTIQDIHMLPAALRPGASVFFSSIPGSTSSPQPWNPRLDGVDAGAPVASSSRQQTLEQARAGGYILPAQARDSSVETFLSLSPAGPSRGSGIRVPAAGTVLQILPSTSAARLPAASNTTGLWFRLQAAVNQYGIPTLEQVPTAFLRVKDENMTVSVVRRYLVHKLRLEHESEVEILCREQILQPTLSLQDVRENIWQRMFDAAAAAVHLPSSSSSAAPDARSRIELPDGSLLSSEDMVLVLHYRRTHQA